MQFEISTARLDAAVSAGILSADQAARLMAFLDSSGAPPVTASDERMEVATGFHDVFIAIGTVLLLAGAWVLGTAWVALPASWGLAEILHRRRGTRLPMIALSISFVASVVFIWAGVRGSSTAWDDLLLSPYALEIAGAALAASLLFLLRFRTPFAAWPTAMSASGLALLSLQHVFGQTWVTEHLIRLLLGTGLTTFAVAMILDMADRRREGWLSAAAFWLHLAAAPQIVHALMLESYLNLRPEGDHAAFLAIGIVLILAVVALIVDRRSLLVSALAYFIGAIAYLVGMKNAAQAFPITLILVGASVLLLGLGWRPLRRLVLAPLPAVLTRRLSPL